MKLINLFKKYLFKKENNKKNNNNKIQIQKTVSSSSLSSISSNLNINFKQDQEKIIIQNNENYEVNNYSVRESVAPSHQLQMYNNPVRYSDIQDINWDNILHIELINNTMILVTFYNYGKNGNDYNQVLIKTSSTISVDVYASVIQVLLKYPVPEMRLVDYYSDNHENEEYLKMTHSLLHQSKLQSNQIYQFISKEVEKQFFLIMEYKSNGLFFNQLDHKEYFSSKQDGILKLHQLGVMLSFDLFCNIGNTNSICSIDQASKWNDQTFFSNLIFYDKPDSNGWYFSITHSSMSFLNNSLFTIVYRNKIQRIKSLLFEIFQNPTNETSTIYQVRKHFSNLNINIPNQCNSNSNSNIKNSTSSSSSLNSSLSSSSSSCSSSSSSSSHFWSINIQKGIAKGIDEIVNNINIDVLKGTKEIVKNMVPPFVNLNCNIWKKSLDSIYCPFLFEVLKEITIEHLNYNNYNGNFDINNQNDNNNDNKKKKKNKK